jgi:alpha-mannosidase
MNATNRRVWLLALILCALAGGIAAAADVVMPAAKPGDANSDLSVSLIGHAHIDFAYLWTWPETREVCKKTFSTLCGLMDEYPFVFSQSQAALYLETKRSSPDIYANMQQLAKSGRWDVSTASAWCEGDTNLSSGEATVRSMLLANRFIKREFGTEPTVGWYPDNFGHTWMLPQILAKSGVRSVCFMRGGIGKPAFWWQAPDGSRVLAYNYAKYNGKVDEDDLRTVATAFDKNTGESDFMYPFGVGDHGGGPTKAMLTTARRLQSTPDYPKVRFSSASDYLDKLAKSNVTLPVYTGELNPIFQGCYTSHADSKFYNRDCENSLASAEVFSSIAKGYSVNYPATDFTSSWRKTCFNEFHDILCGTAIHAAYDYVKQLHDEVATQTKTALSGALDGLASKISTKGPGIPIIVFNPLSWDRTESVTVASPFPGEETHVRMTDKAGRSYPGRSLGDRLTFTARDVPGLGYKVFWASRVSRPVASGVSFDGPVIANQFFRVRVEPKLGVITGIFDKLNNRNVMVPLGHSDVLQILLEKSDSMSAWKIGQIEGSKDLVGDSEVVRVDAGPAKATVVFDHRYGQSVFTQEITLYDAVPRIDIKMTADWHEQWSKENPTPMLKAAFSADLSNPKATFEIPFGSIERPSDGAEVVGQKWIDLSDSNYGLSVLNDCKYGFDVKDNTMRVSLLRASQKPDPDPDQGIHEMTYSLYPHKGDWRAAGTARKGYELNEPLIARVATAHSGALPASKSFVSVSPANIITTALKKAEDDDNLILRFYEANGRPGEAIVQTSLPVRYYAETDLMERQFGDKIPIHGGRFRVKVGKSEIKTYKLFAK